MSENRSSLRFIVLGFAIIAILALSVAAKNSWNGNIFVPIQEFFWLATSYTDPLHTADNNHPASSDANDLTASFNGQIIFQRGFAAAIDFPYSRGGQLFTVDPSTHAETSFGNGSEPNYSTDGSKIVYVVDLQITKSPVASPTPTGLTLLGGGSPIRGFYPKWSPDGANLSYNVGTTVNGTPAYHVKVIDGNCSACDTTIQTHELNPAGMSNYLYPSWNPHIIVPTTTPTPNPIPTHQLVFVRTSAARADIDMGNYTGDIYTEFITIAANGTVTEGNRTPLTNSPATYAFPTYSHDGTKVAFVKFNTDGSSTLNVLNINTDGSPGTVSAIVTYPANGNSYAHHPAWSPDDKKIAFSDSNQILQIDVNTLAQAPVTTLQNSANDLFPSWAPGTAPVSFNATLNFDGRLRDRVSKNDANIGGDGESDGTFTLTLPVATQSKSIASVDLKGPNGNEWDTIKQAPSPSAFWVVGVALDLDAPLLNQFDGTLRSVPVATGIFKLFIGDSTPSSFLSGKSFNVTVNFTDGSTAIGSTTISKTQADLEIRFSPLAAPPPTSVPLGQTATYSILVNNNGPETAFGVFVTGNTPTGTLLDVNTSSFCNSSGPGGVFTCVLGDIDAGTSHATSGVSVRIMTIGFRSARPQQMIIAPSVLPDTLRTIDNIATNNSVSVTTTVVPSVELTGLEVTQGVQNLNNSTPLVADRRTFVRAHVRALNFASGAVQASAFLTARIVGSPTLLGIVKNSNAGGTIRVLQSNPTNGPKRINLDDSFYFEVPSDWTKAGSIEFAFAGNEFPFGCNEADAAKDCKVTVTFQTRKPFSIRLFSTSGKDTSGNYIYPSVADEWQTIIEMASNFPVGVDGVTITADTWTIDQEYCTGAGLLALRDSLVAKRAKDCAKGPCEDFYFALVPESVTDNICGIGFNASGKAAINFGDPTKPGYPVYPSIGVKNDNSGNAAVGLAELFNSRAHELGHNFGFAHTCYKKNADGTFGEGAGCVQVKSGDGTVVLTDGTISLKKADDDPDTYYGFDPFRETLTGVLGPAICGPPYLTPAQPGCDKNYLNHGRIYGPNSPDMMSYGSAAWISAYSYKRIFDSLAPSTPSPSESSLSERINVPAGKIFQINGSITISTGAGRIGSVYTDDFNGTLAAAPIGDWVVSIRNAQGTELSRHGIVITSDPDGGDLAGFSLLAPWDPAAKSIVLLHNGQVAATRQASANSPMVNLTFPNGGETLNGQAATFAWTASDTDGDPLTYEVDYSVDNGSTWKTLAINWTSKTYPVDLTGLVGSTQALIRVIATDGFNSTQAQSAATFTVPPRGPQALISSPDNNHIYVGDQVISLNGMGLDIEDGLLASSRLSWSSNLNGFLGTGSSLPINASTLLEGTHTITLTATDSTALVGSSSINIQVFRTRPVFPAALAAGPTGLAFAANFGSGQSAPQTVSIRNSGDGDLTWSATADQSWIQLASATGSAPTNLDVIINSAGLALGSYAGKITINSPNAANSPQVVNVGLSVVSISTTIGGRVLTADGRGLKNARVSITSSQGITRSVVTNSFGLFSFQGVLSGDIYTIKVASKLFRYTSRTLQVANDVTVADFVGLE